MAAVVTTATTVSSVVDVVLSPFAAATAPGEPAPAPALWTLAAFARREFEQAFSNPQATVNPMAGLMTNGLVIGTPTLDSLSMEPAATGLTGAPLADVSALTTNPQPHAIAEPATFTGEPSLVARVFTAAFRVVSAVGDFLGADLATPLFQLISSNSPPWFTTLGLNVQRREFDGWAVYELAPANTSGKYVVALHGGAYVVEPTVFHWFEYGAMARDTGATVVVPIYPLAPQGTASTVVPQTADLISSQIEQHGAENVSIYGDSSGGGLALAAAQELVRRGHPVPSHMVLLSPWLDVTMSNPAIQFVDDPVWSVSALLRHGQLWAGDLDPTDQLVSPLYGSLAGLPPTAIYSGNLDVLAPDVLVLQDNALAEDADFTFILRNGEIHIWPTFWLFLWPEAIAVLPDIYQQLGVGSQA